MEPLIINRMIKDKVNIIILFVSLLIFGGCYYDNEVDLYGMDDCNTTDISYSGFVQPLLQENCYQCHSTIANQGGVALEGYDAVIPWVNNQRLMGALRHESGFSPMPQNAPQLNACMLDQMQSWIDDGALNN